MPVKSIEFRPGINREITDYGNEGGWYDCNLIRFRSGAPEVIGGWLPFSDNTFIGVCRAIVPFVTLTGTHLIAVGTHKKFYIVRGKDFNDVTPIRDTESLGTDPIETSTSGSGVVTITDNTHGAVMGDYVTLSGATAVDGITADELNTEHAITEVIDTNSYKIDTGGSATSGSTSGGGSSVDAEYQINIGLDTTVLGTGWGAGTWSRGTWGSSASTFVQGQSLRTWSVAIWGEDVLFCIRNGGVYYWDQTNGVNTRAVALSSLSGSDTAPTIATEVITAVESRHAIALGCDPYDDSGTQDPLLIRWSDSEDLTTWTPGTDNTAGSLRVPAGSRIVTGRSVREEILVWTDNTLYTLRLVDAKYIFGLQELASNTTIMSANSVAVVDNTVYWMGERGFYIYSGSVNRLPCAVEDYVFEDINLTQRAKITSGVNAKYQEVFWFYPSEDSDENDRYVVFNYGQNIWYFGQMARTAWHDVGITSYPLAAGTDNKLYNHDRGQSDGSTSPVSAMEPYIQSSYFDLEDGDHFLFVSEFIPDITFDGSEDSATPAATYTFSVKTEPGNGVLESETSDTTRTATSPVEKYTRKGYIRKRGRSIAVKVSSDGDGIRWRLGKLRLNLRPDGRR